MSALIRKKLLTRLRSQGFEPDSAPQRDISAARLEAGLTPVDMTVSRRSARVKEEADNPMLPVSL